MHYPIGNVTGLALARLRWQTDVFLQPDRLKLADRRISAAWPPKISRPTYSCSLTPKICANMCQPELIRTNLIGLDQYEPIWANLGESGPIWANLGQSEEIWANLGVSGQIWTNL